MTHIHIPMVHAKYFVFIFVKNSCLEKRDAELNVRALFIIHHVIYFVFSGGEGGVNDLSLDCVANISQKQTHFTVLCRGRPLRDTYAEWKRSESSGASRSFNRLKQMVILQFSIAIDPRWKPNYKRIHHVSRLHLQPKLCHRSALFHRLCPHWLEKSGRLQEATFLLSRPSFAFFNRGRI